MQNEDLFPDRPKIPGLYLRRDPPHFICAIPAGENLMLWRVDLAPEQVTGLAAALTKLAENIPTAPAVDRRSLEGVVKYAN